MSRAKVASPPTPVAFVLASVSASGIPPSRQFLGYARVSTDSQSLAAQVEQLAAAGATRVFRETASGAKRNRAQLAKLLAEAEHGDVMLVTQLDRLARSTRDLLNVLGVLAERGALFRSLTGTPGATPPPRTGSSC